ncbi:MAG: glutamate 5-kinase, partial [Dehalococcoidia bacterium]|nr:glutamate 5-kinase [Dehalococcoidia bacterium]
MQYPRIVAKVGTSLLTANSDRLDLEAMSRIVGQVVRLRAAGHQVAVVSSGAQAAGKHRLSRFLGDFTPSRQAFASVGQSHLMQSWDELFDW